MRGMERRAVFKSQRCGLELDRNYNGSGNIYMSLQTKLLLVESFAKVWSDDAFS